MSASAFWPEPSKNRQNTAHKSELRMTDFPRGICETNFIINDLSKLVSKFSRSRKMWLMINGGMTE
jgi:hypothetical protein